MVAPPRVPQVVDSQEQEEAVGQGAGPGIQGQQDLPADRQDPGERREGGHLLLR